MCLKKKKGRAEWRDKGGEEDCDEGCDEGCDQGCEENFGEILDEDCDVIWKALSYADPDPDLDTHSDAAETLITLR